MVRDDEFEEGSEMMKLRGVKDDEIEGAGSQIMRLRGWVTDVEIKGSGSQMIRLREGGSQMMRLRGDQR